MVRSEQRYRPSSSSVAYNFGWGEIHEAWLVEHGEHRGTFLSAEGSRGGWSSWPVASGSASAVVGRPGYAQRATRGRNAEPWPELRHRRHQECSASSGASSSTESFLRNSIEGLDPRGVSDERESQVSSPAPKVVEHALPVTGFIVRGAGVSVGHAEPEGVVEENRELPRGGRHGFGLACSGREAAIEGAQSGLSSADVHCRDPQQRGRAVGGPTRPRAEQSATRHLITWGQAEPRRE